MTFTNDETFCKLIPKIFQVQGQPWLQTYTLTKLIGNNAKMHLVGASWCKDGGTINFIIFEASLEHIRSSLHIAPVVVIRSDSDWFIALTHLSTPENDCCLPQAKRYSQLLSSMQSEVARGKIVGNRYLVQLVLRSDLIS